MPWGQPDPLLTAVLYCTGSGTVSVTYKQGEGDYPTMSIVTIPITDLRRDLSNLVPNLTKPVFVTQRGRVKAVLLDIEMYNDMLDRLEDALDAADPEIQHMAAEAQAAQERGETIPLEDVLQKYGL